MISSPQFSRLAAACAALLIAGALAEPARAQDVTCKDDAVSISGRAKFRPFTKTKELEGRGAAMADAVANWEREVGTRFGAKWGTWSRATNTTFSCEATKTGKVIGSSFIGCTISGRPCARTSPLAGAIVEDDDGNEVRRPRGKRQRVDDDDGLDKGPEPTSAGDIGRPSGKHNGPGPTGGRWLTRTIWRLRGAKRSRAPTGGRWRTRTIWRQPGAGQRPRHGGERRPANGIWQTSDGGPKEDGCGPIRPQSNKDSLRTESAQDQRADPSFLGMIGWSRPLPRPDPAEQTFITSSSA